LQQKLITLYKPTEVDGDFCLGY